MSKFVRTNTRAGYDDECWKEGYVFESYDYNFNPACGQTYVKEMVDDDFRMHSAESVKSVEWT